MENGSERLFDNMHNEPLSGRVLHEIREAIVDSRLPPGMVINQVSLSKQFGVSRAPIREALRQLEKDGLVTNVPYRGTVVTPLTAHNVEELQSLRRLFETFAAEQFVANGDGQDIDRLERVVQAMREAAAVHDMTALNAMDIAFHTVIIELGDHSLLLETWERYTPLLRRALALRNRENPDAASIVSLHEDLLAAFRLRDLDQIVTCYSRHGADMVEWLTFHLNDEVQHHNGEGVAAAAT